MPLEPSKNGDTEETWLQLSLLTRLGLVPKEVAHKGAVMLSCSAAERFWDQQRLRRPCADVKNVPEESALAHVWSCL